MTATKRGHYLNEFDAGAAEWMRELIKGGHLPKGEVDERDIREVKGCDLAGYRQCHFFAGLAGWPLALRLAGWPESLPVWTGSCPCQPFSAAGKQKGEADERHVWPEFRRLIAECLPPIVFGEQVASKLGRMWLAGVRSDLETLGYEFGGSDLCAAGVGSPHIRQRLYWVACRVADAGSQSPRDIGRSVGEDSAERRKEAIEFAGCGPISGMGESFQSRLEGLTGDGHDRHQPGRFDADEVGPASAPGSASGVGNANLHERDDTVPEAAGFARLGPDDAKSDDRRGAGELARTMPSIGMAHSESRDQRRAWECRESERSGELSVGRYGGGFWDAFDLISCRDGKTRRVESGSFPLAHGVSGRVGLLRGYGNAIVPPLAAVFIRSFLEAKGLKGQS
ncbi:DNA cytosine methyltransferase [Zavarzinella formosa]|uniref:DNA cytosine methyltransferase n=1 Tax=Zavarzinella formosa TaxID=360055 RepID=UPI0002F66C0C|nr:DNA cytosine methyltransferase [Zavarzinella formosa]